MRRFQFPLLLAGLAIVCGCSDSSAGHVDGDHGEAGESSLGGASAIGSGSVQAGAATDWGDGNGNKIFTAESEAIQIDWFNFFDGGYRFARRRDQLSHEQLDLVEAIKVVSSTDDCWEDAVEMSVTVTAGDSNRAFSANEYVGTCGRDVTMVDFEAVGAVLGTVQCLSSQGYDGRSLESAPTIVPDDGCWHGLFNFAGASPAWWFRMQIPTAGEYRILLDGSGDRGLLLDLFESDPTTKLASASVSGECPVLTHTFANSGLYSLQVQMQSGTQAGDFFLALESTTSH